MSPREPGASRWRLDCQSAVILAVWAALALVGWHFDVLVWALAAPLLGVGFACVLAVALAVLWVLLVVALVAIRAAFAPPPRPGRPRADDSPGRTLRA